MGVWWSHTNARPAGGFAGSGLLPHVMWVYGGHTLMLDQLVALQAVVYCLMLCGCMVARHMLCVTH